VVLVDEASAALTLMYEILRDEVLHMNYTYTQLTRISPGGCRRRVWRARASRLWRRYLRLAAAVAAGIGTLVLTLQYFIILPPFAWLAKRRARRERSGWTPIPSGRDRSLTRQY